MHASSSDVCVDKNKFGNVIFYSYICIVNRKKEIMKLLEDIVFATKTNNWYAPTCEFQEKYRSIVGAHFTDMSSSAGDWSGFFLQKTGRNTCVAIPFSQENNYPHAGFTLYTGKAYCKGPLTSEFHKIAEEMFYKKCI